MNRAQQRSLYRQMKSHKNAQNKAQDFVNYGRKVQKNFVEGNTTYTEIVFNALGLALHRKYGFGKARVAEVWKMADQLIGEYGQGLFSSDEIKQKAEEEIGISCNYGEVMEGEYRASN